MPKRNSTQPVNDNTPDAASKTSTERTSGCTTKAAKGTCPICSAPRIEAYRPFCSKRCADVDLNRWLSGSYAIPVVEEDGATTGEDDTP